MATKVVERCTEPVEV